MTNKTMLPCPFCGSYPIEVEWPEGGETGDVCCLGIGCPIDEIYIPIDQWNSPRERPKGAGVAEPVAVFEIDRRGYRARVVLDPEKPFPPNGTELFVLERPVHTMNSIREAVESSKVYTVLQLDQCLALAQVLNGVKS